MEALLFCSALWNMTPLLKNIRKWGKLQEAVRPVCGCPCVNTSAYFHLSSSSTNMFTFLLKLLTYFMKLDIFTLDSSTQMHVLPALCCEICNHNCDIFRGSEAHCTVLQAVSPGGTLEHWGGAAWWWREGVSVWQPCEALPPTTLFRKCKFERYYILLSYGRRRREQRTKWKVIVSQIESLWAVMRKVENNFMHFPFFRIVWTLEKSKEISAGLVESWNSTKPLYLSVWERERERERQLQYVSFQGYDSWAAIALQT